MQRFFCRWAKSLGELESSHQGAWGTLEYDWKKHRNQPTVFFGLYDLRDYIALWWHKGKKWVLWAGSDIRNLRSNFIFNDGKLLWLSQLFSSRGESFRDFLIRRVLSKAEHWVENEAEAWQLKDMGLKVSGIRPSFLGNIKKYKVSFRPGNKVYISASKKREAEYGWPIILQIAWALPQVEFHLYGSDWDWIDVKKDQYTPGYVIQRQGITWKDFYPNIIIHGRISKEKMNRQIKNMQCGLRLNKHDGFSEITAKSVLWGQYPITYLYHPNISQFAADNHGLPNTANNLRKLVELLKQIPKKKKPNYSPRDWYIANLNRYPWVHDH